MYRLWNDVVKPQFPRANLYLEIGSFFALHCLLFAPFYNLDDHIVLLSEESLVE